MADKLLIKNAVLLGPQGTREADLLAEDGIITEIAPDIAIDDEIIRVQNGENAEQKPNIQIIDAAGLTVMPAFADMHAHLRDPGFTYKETLETGINAALNGGYTHIVAMANTKPVPDCVEVISDIMARADKIGKTKVFQCGSVTKGLEGKEMVDFASLLPFTKFFSDDGKNVDDEEIFARALRASGELGFTILDHTEPEVDMVIRNLAIAKMERGRLHFCHVSKKDSMLAIMQAKDEGLPVTVEVTPHHLFGWDMDYRVNPPFAAREDVDFLLRAIAEGYVDCISTDHAPHTQEDKAAGAMGISGIEVAFGIINTVFDKAGINGHTLSRLMSLNPMNMMGVDSGVLQKGKEANLVIVDRDARYTVDPETFKSMGKNNPFKGAELTGKVIHTIKKGVLLK